MSTLFSTTGAAFSDCRRYRYRLWRVWDESLPRAVFIMMNPSTADEIENDPTIERCQRRALAWSQNGMYQVGGIEVVNAFAWRETDSRRLKHLLRASTDIVGPDNDAEILSATESAAVIVCAWGKPAALGGRDVELATMLRGAGRTLHTLARNADGSPSHPLYLAYSIQPQEWKA